MWGNQADGSSMNSTGGKGGAWGKGQGSADQGQWGRSRGAMEHKAVTHMKTQGNDRSGYRMWHEKLVNAFAQVNNQYRGILERLAQDTDHDEDVSVSDHDSWVAWLGQIANPPEHDRVDVKTLNEDMYSVLMDKTEGEAWQRVKTVRSGRGLEAFVKVYKWFMGTSGQGLSERARAIMSPAPPKNEGDIAEAVDKWSEGLRLLQSHRGYKMSIQLKVTAVKMLMVGRAKDQFETWEQEIPKGMKTEDEEDKAWIALLGKVQDYATRRRLEANMRGKGAVSYTHLTLPTTPYV